jgi:hypothetical protein
MSARCKHALAGAQRSLRSIAAQHATYNTPCNTPHATCNAAIAASWPFSRCNMHEQHKVKTQSLRRSAAQRSGPFADWAMSGLGHHVQSQRSCKSTRCKRCTVRVPFDDDECYSYAPLVRADSCAMIAPQAVQAVPCTVRCDLQCEIAWRSRIPFLSVCLYS